MMEKIKNNVYLYTGTLLEENIGRINQEAIVKKIINKTCEVLNIEKQLLLSKSRVQDIADARHMVSALLREKTSYSLSKIGKVLNKNHATILASIKRCEDLKRTDLEFLKKYLLILQSL